MQEDRSDRIQAAMALVRQAMSRIRALSDALDPSGPGSTLAAVAERLYDERRRRDEYFPQGLFGEPAWDMLLALFIAREEGREMGIAEACEASGVSIRAGRALIAKLESRELLVRQRSQIDRRRYSVYLTDYAIERLTAYLTMLI